MDKIFIENLQVQGILGIHPHEQRVPQRILVSVEVAVNIVEAAEQDNILKTVDYSTLTKDITSFIKSSHYETVEALIEALAKQILINERVKSVRLRLEKPDAIPEAESAGVEITRTR